MKKSSAKCWLLLVILFAAAVTLTYPHLPAQAQPWSSPLLVGTVNDIQNVPVAGAEVTLRAGEDGEALAEAHTQENGLSPSPCQILSHKTSRWNYT